MKFLWLFLILTACATRAPTAYELDRRAGLMPLVESERLKQEADAIRSMKANDKLAVEPPRSKPRLERVWVYDQELEGGYWLQGTYVYLEVEPGRWVEEAAP